MSVREQGIHVNEAREVYAKVQAEYVTFRERLSGLRAQLNVWHRESSELHSQRESISRDLAVLDERRRALVASQSSLQSELERSINEEKLAHERFSEIDQEAAGLQTEFNEAKSQLAARAQEALQARQTERISADEKLQAARETIASIHTQHAETQARLDELAARAESQKQKLDAIQQTIRSAEADVRKAEQIHETAKTQRVQADEVVQRAIVDAESKRSEVEKLESERRAKLEERVTRQAGYSRAQAQLDILIQAEQSLAGYAEGARYLLDAARQSRLNARGALERGSRCPCRIGNCHCRGAR